MVRWGIDHDRPWYEKRSWVHILGRQWTNSSQVFLVSSGLARKPPSSVQVAERPVPTSSLPPEMISSVAVRSAIFIGWLNSGTQTMMPWPTLIRLVRIAQAVRNISGAEQWEYS